MTAFRTLERDVSFPKLEAEILAIWKERDVFRRSVEARPLSSRYVFYDGPPFATGLPHYGHLVPLTLKDIVPRYWTMRGHRVERRFGWDTHGLPIEMEIEKQLGLSGPSSIRDFGVSEFNEACRAGVLRYTAEWERIVGRLGRWVDFDNDYKTMDPTFMESVWWVFKSLWEKGLVYRDFRVMPYSWRLSTSLSNFEANLDYRDVQDPSLTVTMPERNGDRVLLVWTTTPWTLPSNLAVAVGADIEYVAVRRPGDDTVYVVASERAEAILGGDLEIVETFPGSALVGTEYVPLFDFFGDKADLPAGEGRAFFVIASDHVTTTDGSGLVHMAPDFGEEDFAACRRVGIGVLESVDAEGRFTDAIATYAGRNVKEADPDIIRDIKAMGRLVRHDTITHSYPFCWRSDTPLIYKALPAWFVRVTDLRDRMSEHNRGIHWVPEKVGSKRFGNWLADARDWNVSRDRFWGTPLPVWHCEPCDTYRCIGSIAELETLSGAEVDDLHPHRIDHLTVPCESCGEPAARIRSVFDCWFESGSMPYAQEHYPFEEPETFGEKLPAQFIAEGLDQTRGWFYTLLVLSTALFDRPPFRNVVVNGMVLAEDGSKMSKRKKNYLPVETELDDSGADALRTYLINSPIVRAEPLRFSERGVREVIRTVMLPLRNAWAFFTQYANLDGWTPLTEAPPVSERPVLDRWVLSVLQSLIGDVNKQMEGYYLYKVVPPVIGFIDHLTNWYIRRSRRRFWRSVDDAAAAADKAAAYATLYEVLVTFTKVMAPVQPFMAEGMYQHLVVEPGVAPDGIDSVHLCDYPMVDASMIDAGLEADIALVRQVVRLGRALRERHRLKTRQPLRRVTLVHHDAGARAAVQAHTDLIVDELNVREVVVTDDESALAVPSFKANFKRLGRRYGKQMKAAAAAISELTSADWQALQGGASLDVLGQDITAEDVLVSYAPKGDVVVESDGPVTVALDTELDESLRREGIAREMTSRLQRLRKAAGLDVSDRITVRVASEAADLIAALSDHRDAIAQEVLAVRFDVGVPGPLAESVDVDGLACTVDLARA